jgi:hypothetical protein
MIKELCPSELGFEPDSLLFFPLSQSSVFQGAIFQSSKSQAPSSRETSSTKHQSWIFGIWSFSGAWMLVLGASF